MILRPLAMNTAGLMAAAGPRSPLGGSSPNTAATPETGPDYFVPSSAACLATSSCAGLNGADIFVIAIAAVLGTLVLISGVNGIVREWKNLYRPFGRRSPLNDLVQIERPSLLKGTALIFCNLLRGPSVLNISQDLSKPNEDKEYSETPRRLLVLRRDWGSISVSEAYWRNLELNRHGVELARQTVNALQEKIRECEEDRTMRREFYGKREHLELSGRQLRTQAGSYVADLEGITHRFVNGLRQLGEHDRRYLYYWVIYEEIFGKLIGCHKNRLYDVNAANVVSEYYLYTRHVFHRYKERLKLIEFFLDEIARDGDLEQAMQQFNAHAPASS